MAVYAFPTAEGYGRNALGGRGTGSPTPVIERVTNTNDSGTGSLREALSKNYPRFVHFDVGGTLAAQSILRIQNPYCTVSFQTAPGDGFQIKNYHLSIETHNVVVRHGVCRPGVDALGANWFTAPTSAPNAILIYSPGTTAVHDVITDHCTAAWSSDENFTTYGETVYNITRQWGLVYEAVRRQLYPYGSYAALIGAGVANTAGTVCTVSYHHNLFINNGARHPLFNAYIMKAGGATAVFPAWRFDLRNNLFYNWYSNGYGQFLARLRNETQYNNCQALSNNFSLNSMEVNIVGNHWIKGPNSNVSDLGCFWLYDHARCRIYALNNIGPRSSSPLDGSNIGPNFLTQRWDGDSQTSIYYPGWDPSSHFTSVEWPMAPVTTQSVGELEALLIAKAGARYWDRDSTDTRVINEFIARTGYAQYQNHFDYPTVNSGTPPTDTDNDGIPDAWESSHGGSLNPFDTAPNGYFHYENYINELAGDSITGYGSGVSAWFLTKSRQGKKASGAIY